MITRFLFVFAILFSTSAFAEDPLIAKARKGYSLATTDATLAELGSTVGESVVNGLNQSLSSQGKSISDEKAKLIIDRFTVEFFTLMKKLEDDILQIYVDTYTERELDLLIEVHSDPEIAALMAKMPKVMGEMMPMIQQEVPSWAERIVGDLKDEGVLTNL